jgi:hypothetical protein
MVDTSMIDVRTFLSNTSRLLAHHRGCGGRAKLSIIAIVPGVEATTASRSGLLVAIPAPFAPVAVDGTAEM